MEIATINNKEKILICHRYKQGVQDENLSFPGAYPETNETPLKAAKRDLHEEYSLKSSTWKCLGSFIINGNRSNGKDYLYSARDLDNTTNIFLDDLEETKLIWYELI